MAHKEVAVNFEFKIGTPVFNREGEIGRLKYLVVDPPDEVITSLIVERGHLRHKDVVVPVSWVEQADDQRVVLAASTAEVEALPEYREVEYRVPDATARSVAGHPPTETLIWVGSYPTIVQQYEQPWVLYQGRIGVGDDEVVVKRGQPVHTSDGQRVATLDHVLADDKTHRIQHLVVHRGQWLQRGEDLVVPADAVASISDDDIRLRLNRDELGRLAHYRPPMDDTQLEEAVSRGLQTQPETKGQDLRVQVDRGLVRLFGEVPETGAAAAKSIARRIQGVIGVEDHTTRSPGASRANGASVAATDGSDAALTTQITEALQRQTHEDLSDVRVRVDQGTVHLSGTTRNIPGKALADQIVRTVPGVRSVDNALDADTAIRARVEAAMAADPRTALVPIEVICRSGVVTLLGDVPSVEVKDAAEQIARRAAGGKNVISELEVCPVEDKSVPIRPVWQQAPM
jgi:osmotically-inducible protein OsmY/sporulation protein YlmC with PRC-barrel domain